MPELPDLTAYLEAIAERALERMLVRLRFVSPFVLRSVDPPASELEGRRLVALERLGKRLVFVFEEERFLVLHLMIAGRLLWKERSGKRPGRIALAELEFDSGTLWLTEAGTKKRAAIHLVRGRDALTAHDPGGIEPLAADFATFRAALGRENRTLKRALTDPRLVAGIGNAYSDEILHAARLSPLARTEALGDEAWRRLHASTLSTLADWIARLRAERAGGFPAKVTAFRPDLAVHGRFGQPCPRCGGPVQRIVYAENEANYCPACQTGGRLLADRALSQLLKGDWPKTLEELEERRAGANAGGGGPQAARATRLALAVALGVGGGVVARAEVPPDNPPAARPRHDVELTLPLPARAADSARLERARSLLSSGVQRQQEAELGPFALLTDVADATLLDRAARVAAAFDESYRNRYGLVPIGRARETVVLFAREADYRQYQRAEPEVGGIAEAAGVAGGGVAATYVGDRAAVEVLATLVHEWAHLANRRALGPALPAWLDEGIAQDLGASEFDELGRLRPGSWSRMLRPLEVTGTAGGWTITGGEASLRELATRWATEDRARTPSLVGALALDGVAFSGSPAAELHYALASGLLRLLLADARLRPALCGWLGEVSTGAPPDLEELRGALGLSWPELERRLADRTLAEVEALPALPPPLRGAGR